MASASSSSELDRALAPTASARFRSSHAPELAAEAPAGPARAAARSFSADDIMPTTVQRARWAAMLELVQNPEQLDATLHRLTAAAAAGRQRRQ